MTVIYTPKQTEIILHTIAECMAGNNGWSFVPDHAWLLNALQEAGLVVIRSTDWHGRPAYKAYTRSAQDALRADAAAGYPVESTYKPVKPRIEGPDYEAAILARQERDMMDY